MKVNDTKKYQGWARIEYSNPSLNKPKENIQFRVNFSLYGELLAIETAYDDLPQSAQILTFGNKTYQCSKYLKEALNLAIPVLAIEYIKVEECPEWLKPIKIALKTLQFNTPQYQAYFDEKFQYYKKDPYMSMIWNFRKHKYQAVQAIKVLDFFKNYEMGQLKALKFLDKYGDASSTLISCLENHPRLEIVKKAKEAKAKFEYHLL